MAAPEPRRRPRFFIAPEHRDGEQIRIVGREAHHLKHVLRKQEGDVVEVTDGEGHVYTVRIVRVYKDHVDGHIEREEDAAQEWQHDAVVLSVAIAVVKDKAMSLMLQKAVELGVSHIYPVCSERSIVPYEEGLRDKKSERWHDIIRDAAKQSHNLKLPVLHDMVPLKDMVHDLKKTDCDRWVLLDPYGQTSFAELDKMVRDVPKPYHIGVCIGPEGGWSPQEEEQWRKVGVEGITCGDVVMRAETAFMFMASVVRAWQLAANAKGFGIGLLLMSLFLAGTLATVGLPLITEVQDRTKKVLVHADAEQLSAALELYYRDHGTYPVGDNAAMVEALNHHYIDFSSETLKRNEAGALEFIDPWKHSYTYAYRAGDESYVFQSQGAPVRAPWVKWILPRASESAEGRRPVWNAGTVVQRPVEHKEQLDNSSEESPEIISEAPKPVPAVPVTSDPVIETPVEAPTPEIPQPVENLLPIHVTENDGMLFVSITNIPLKLDQVLMERKMATGAFSNYPLSFLEEGGNAIFVEGSPTFHVLDFQVNNDTAYAYQGVFWQDPHVEQALHSQQGSGTPRANAGAALQSAKEILNDPAYAVDGPYGVSPEDIYESLMAYGVPLYWGFEPSVLSSDGTKIESTLGYTLSYLDAQGIFHEMIIVNQGELAHATPQEIATLLSHEGTHHLWNHEAPPLPQTATPSPAPRPDTERGSVNRSENSVDEEYSAIVLSLLFWERAKGDERDDFYDELLAEYRGAQGEKNVRDDVRVLYYDLPEY